MNAARESQSVWEAALRDKAVQTPTYVYAMDEISAQMRALSEALGTPVLSVVAACNNSDVLARLADDVRFGARCASRYEMNVVAGWKSDHLYLGMPVLDAVSARSARRSFRWRTSPPMTTSASAPGSTATSSRTAAPATSSSRTMRATNCATPRYSCCGIRLSYRFYRQSSMNCSCSHHLLRDRYLNF